MQRCAILLDALISAAHELETDAARDIITSLAELRPIFGQAPPLRVIVSPGLDATGRVGAIARLTRGYLELLQHNLPRGDAERVGKVYRELLAIEAPVGGSVEIAIVGGVRDTGREALNLLGVLNAALIALAGSEVGDVADDACAVQWTVAMAYSVFDNLTDYGTDAIPAESAPAGPPSIGDVIALIERVRDVLIDVVDDDNVGAIYGDDGYDAQRAAHGLCLSLLGAAAVFESHAVAC